MMNFPKMAAHDDAPKPQTTAGKYKMYQCLLCAFIYDEAAGLPDEGIAPGTRWADVPDTWSCPDCSASKSEFDMIEITADAGFKAD